MTPADKRRARRLDFDTRPSCPACGELLRRERVRSNHDRSAVRFLACRCGQRRPRSRARGGVGVKAAAGPDSFADAELHALLAGGMIVGLGEDALDRFRAQGDGQVFRVTADR